MGLAIAAPWPTHVACDSQAVCNGMWQLLDMCGGTQGCEQYADVDMSGPWGAWMKASRPDADLWHFIKQVVEAKGAQSIRVTKVVSHLSRSDVDNG
eukprot:4003291-Alexandrium_andersonii.AAC.1